MLVCAAIKAEDGTIFKGWRHCYILQEVLKSGFSRRSVHSANQGFMDDQGNWLDRETAAQHALDCGQVEKLKYQQHLIFSEELWDMKGQHYANHPFPNKNA